MIKPNDIPTEKAIFASAWALMVEGLEASNDEAWGSVKGHAEELQGKGNDAATKGLASSLAWAVWNYLEAKEREKHR